MFNCFLQIIDHLSKLSAIGTLILAWIIYKKFLLQKSKEKQLEVVCDLISSIQNTFNIAMFSEGRNFHTTLFDIPEIEDWDNYENLYFFNKDIHDYDDKEKIVLHWNFFFEYYSNPLLPKAIADKLKLFNLTKWVTKPYEKIQNERSIVLGNKGYVHSDSSCYYYPNTRLERCQDFKVLIIELKKEIEEWFRTYGIKDINITSSHHLPLKD